MGVECADGFRTCMPQLLHMYTHACFWCRVGLGEKRNEQTTGRKLGSNLPHITLFWKGTPSGLGIPTAKLAFQVSIKTIC